MDTKALFLELAKYNYLNDITGYSQEYQDKYKAAIDTVLDRMLSEMIEDDISTQ